MNDALKERLFKLLRLSKAGVGGERANAEAYLIKLLSKHGLTMADIDDESIELVEVVLPFASSLERKLANQVIYAALGKTDHAIYRRRKTILTTVTPAQKAEIAVTYEVLRRSLREEVGVFYSAFIMRNHVYPAQSSADLPEPTPEELAKLLRARQMAKGIKQSHIRKQLTGEAP